MKEESLWDVEQRQKKKIAELEEIKNVVGRDTFLPRELVGVKLSLKRVSDPEMILREMGYKLLTKGGWAKNIDSTSRFHVYIGLDREFLYIHKDRLVNNKHKSSKDGCHKEKVLIHKLVEHHYPSPTEGWVKDRSCLSQVEIKEALERLKKENHSVANRFKRFFKQVYKVIN